MNRKGYMLVEIILASAIAFGIAYFILDLTIKLKNKNDDLVVETLVTTDQTIISNKLMEYAISETEEFDCTKLSVDGKKVIYKNEIIDIVDNYAKIGNITCTNELGEVSVKIPLTVAQMKDKEYDVVVDYKYKIGNVISPETP